MEISLDTSACVCVCVGELDDGGDSCVRKFTDETTGGRRRVYIGEREVGKVFVFKYLCCFYFYLPLTLSSARFLPSFPPRLLPATPLDNFIVSTFSLF
jgi:hypothetical protein